ncbi:NAD(P)-binding domain-containing protein [Kosakonia sp. S58]|uniref:NAD(P)-binding domain-containing protein n=1 Tax=unclassified Kosakonia TaxID=2632876 RepID=UPI001903903E|nr:MULTISPECIES: NAD(P)-binding domain-containing protein [unclassified Kosakonia]MBK0079801.1 NAD(P)-binding domain-containing protein [Kosakonia sp. S57]MBK0086689.1 NAD(P)-binding domain-containing protein [Kosakonia sp. S58]
MRTGILGVGDLTEKIVAGFYRAQTAAEIILSPRNAARAEKLRDAYGCQVAKSNQSVVDRADNLIVGVRPDALPQLASEIILRPGQTVISLVAGVSIPHLQALFRHDRIIRMMLTYAAEINRSTVVLSAYENEVVRYFSVLGEVTVLDTEDAFELATVSMCMNGWFYHLADGLQNWLLEKGMAQNDARALVLGAMRDCAEYAGHNSQKPLGTMLKAIATEGTYTAQGVDILEQQRSLQPWIDAANKVSESLTASQLSSKK